MLNRNSIYKLFIVLILLSTFSGYFIGSGIIAYGPIILCMLLITLLEITLPKPMRVSDWGACFIWIPYVLLAFSYYMMNPLDGRYLTTNLLAIITLPILTLSLIRLLHGLNYDQLVLFLHKIILYFSLAQLIICIGQISTYTFGIGFPVNQEYVQYSMISGTFTNSNDLGATILVLSFIYTSFEPSLNKNRNITWVLLFSLIIISGSRSALFMSAIIYMKSRNISLKNILYSILIFTTFYLLVFKVLDKIKLDVFSQILKRIDSLIEIFKSGIQSDNSASFRIESYLHFIKNLDKLGYGSGELNNYFKYSEGATFDTSLMFRNPHSLIVEIGYWLGIPGLFFFLMAISYLLIHSRNKLALILVLLISSLIPSSLLGSLIYFTLIIITFYSHSYTLERKSKA